MEEAFGVPSTRTPLRERYLDGEHGWKVNDYGNGALWVDAHTAIMLYEDRMGLQARYFDLDQVAALDAADTLKRARDAIERNKKTSNTQF